MMSLTLNSTDTTYATNKTIHHYALWTAAPGGTSLMLRKQPKYNATQVDLSKVGLTSGAYDVYLEMVGQPSIQNLMSNVIHYTQP